MVGGPRPTVPVHPSNWSPTRQSSFWLVINSLTTPSTVFLVGPRPAGRAYDWSSTSKGFSPRSVTVSDWFSPRPPSFWLVSVSPTVFLIDPRSVGRFLVGPCIVPPSVLLIGLHPSARVSDWYSPLRPDRPSGCYLLDVADWLSLIECYSDWWTFIGGDKLTKQLSLVKREGKINTSTLFVSISK